MIALMTITITKEASGIVLSTGLTRTKTPAITGSGDGLKKIKTAGMKLRMLSATIATRVWSSGRASGTVRKTNVGNE